MGLLGLIVAAVVAIFAADTRRRLRSAEARLAKVGDQLARLIDEMALARRQPGAATPEAAPLQPAATPRPAPAIPAQSGAVPAITAAVAATPAAAKGPSLEESLGTRWAVWVGGVALALGAVLMVRYSIELGVFGPGVRTALSGLLGLALVAAGEWFRRSERRSPIEVIPSAHIPGVLTAAGTVAAFATVYAAHALYGFIGPAAAFVLLGAIGIATMAAAALHGPALAGLGLAGSFATPALVASSAPNPWALVIYLAIISAAAYWLAGVRRWLWLAIAVVAGVLAWSWLIAVEMDGRAGTLWHVAGYTHALVQLALAALAFALVPHVATRDADARPDWIAAAALAALALVAILMLEVTRTSATGWGLFACLAGLALLATAVLRAPVAAAAALAGLVALAAIAFWPGLKAQPEPRLMWDSVADFIRLPDNVTSFLWFAVMLSLVVLAAGAGRLWRGRDLTMSVAGLYALAAVVTPLLALILAYLRVTQFDRSIPFAGAAVALGAVFLFAANRFQAAPAPHTDSQRLAAGAFGSGVAAAATLAFAVVAERGYLTAALAVVAATTALFAARHQLRLLRYVVVAIGLIVLARLAWDPRIMGADVGRTPVFNWLLIGYGLPALAFLAAGRILRPAGDDLAVRLCDGLGVLFAALLGFFQIRHALNGGDPLAPITGHVEQGLFATLGFGLSYVLSRADMMRGNVVFRFASLAFGVLSGLIAVFGLALLENPAFSNDPIGGGPLFSTLVLGYLLPAIVAGALARASRGVRPAWYVTGAAVAALGLLFAFVTLEVRHLFQGEHIGLFQLPATQPEVWSYSAAWLALGLAFLAYGIVRGVVEARLASAVLVVLAAVKVFAFDVAGLGGLWRALSLIFLGLVLMGIGLVYQRLIFARPAAPTPSTGG